MLPGDRGCVPRTDRQAFEEIEMDHALVIGDGEVGGPLAGIIGEVYQVHMRDVEEARGLRDRYAWLHVCYPWSDSFVAVTAGYIERYDPMYCVVHSTVVPGASAAVQERTPACRVIYSPVRGRHGDMAADMQKYTKYVAGRGAATARTYFDRAGIPAALFPYPMRVLELAKLWETSYTALLITWSQELRRFSEALGVDRAAVLELTREVEHLPRKRFYPGHIGGHCLVQNLDLLDALRESPLVQAIRVSNELAKEWANGVRHGVSEL